MVKCESKKDAMEIAENHINFHNKLFENDLYKIDVQNICKEVWVKNKYNEVIEIYQW